MAMAKAIGTVGVTDLAAIVEGTPGATITATPMKGSLSPLLAASLLLARCRRVRKRDPRDRLSNAVRLAGLRQGLGEAGYVEGQRNNRVLLGGEPIRSDARAGR
jgi:hypothetical protein